MASIQVTPGGQAASDPTAPAVEVSSLCKRYGNVEAVKDVSFSVQHSEVFAFLGPNGAGKIDHRSRCCARWPARPAGGHLSPDST